jgi:hypothetical protein
MLKKKGLAKQALTLMQPHHCQGKAVNITDLKIS